MAAEMRANKDVFLSGEEVGKSQGAYKISQGLLDEFGAKRVIDTPITEHGFAGIGVGAAFGGLKPIVEFMTFNFAMQAIDHIINSAAKTLYMSGGQIRAGIVFRGPNGAASRVGAQHSQDYSAWYANVPGLKVIAPYDAADAKGLMKAAIRDNNPVLFFEHVLLYNIKGDAGGPDEYQSLEKAELVRSGTDCTIFTYSRMRYVVMQAVQELERLGLINQALIKSAASPDDRALRQVLDGRALLFMPILREVDGTSLTTAPDLYAAKPVAFEITFVTEDYFKLGAPSLRARKARVWVNSLEPRHAAGHVDADAVLDPDAHWGHLIGLGANIIQTDEPGRLIDYLQEKRLR
jgi:hypothetical protein